MPAVTVILLMTITMAACTTSPLAPALPAPPVHTRQTALPGLPPGLPAIRYTVQAGAFSTAERAERYAAALNADGLDAYYFIDTDGLYKVRFERYDTRTAARRRAEELKSRGIIDSYYIVRPAPGNMITDQAEALRRAIVDTARRFIGAPYRWGGESRSTGFDCSGLTMTVYRLNGLELPRSSGSQFSAGRPVDPQDIREGDLVFFSTSGGNRVSHVGIYAGGGRFIHAPGRGKQICTASLYNRYFARRFRGTRRYLRD